MPSTRRTFVKNGAIIATGAALAKLTPHQLAASPVADRAGNWNDGWKALIQHGLDAAKSNGSSYTDIRITFTQDRKIFPNMVRDEEAIHCGVRCLVNGYWGFASGPVLGKSEMERLAREAALQAKGNTIGPARTAELASRPVVASGQWTMPVQIDPFDVHPLDGCDLLRSLSAYCSNLKAQFSNPIVNPVRQDKAFGASDGSYWTQRVFRISLGSAIVYAEDGRSSSRGFDPYFAGAGWELLEANGLRAYVDAKVEECKEDLKLSAKMVDVGRYPLILDARSVANVLSGTVGLATELDRALGYEANASGTSYLNAPDEMILTQKMSSPLLSVTANRNETGGIATVQWDDDGVVSGSFPLVRDGVLQGFQTTRESAYWMRSTGSTVASTGCAYAETGVDAPITRTGNLVMTPADSTATVSDLYRDLKTGVMFAGMGANMDFQQLNGLGTSPTCYEITNGKRTAILVNAGLLFQAPELWKSLRAIGGRSSALRSAVMSRKGQPAQLAFHNVTAVPAMFENGTIIDFTRKA